MDTTFRFLNRKGDLRNQIQRAALSISNNIAEGFERGSTQELIHFLYIARGSAGEVRSMFCVMDRMSDFEDLRSEISSLKLICESISRQIRAWCDSLQNSEIKGQRHLNDRSRAAFQRKRSGAKFRQQQEQFRDEFEARLKREAEEYNRRRDKSQIPILNWQISNLKSHFRKAIQNCR